MSQGFTPEFMEELKYKTDIVDVISQYVPLQKKGGRYFGCCPFHHEKTPSFCVNQDSGFYHCFGCGVSGDVIKFVMEMESMSFFDVVKYLAEKAGMQLPEIKIDPKYSEKKERNEVLKQLMRDAARYYRNNLVNPVKGKDARAYLESRGINEETAHRYGLGLSLDYDSMVGYMRRKGHSLKDLLDSGLISNVDRPSDAFANRIIVPIINSMNEVVAFGGRIYHGEKDVAKYKNSTNTVLFDKGRTIYGVNYVKQDKRAGEVHRELILVEGYMDVISLGAAGIRNAVAGMGTALTDGQAHELKRLVPKIYVCYDGDGAGRKATVKNVEPLVKCGLDVRVVMLDDGKDPDETVRADGYDGFMKHIGEALPVIEYKLK
ncbi:MAG: DNA primase, partial [Clostridia bacterium]|nr:DNA primase [Clostridia bacterium]